MDGARADGSVRESVLGSLDWRLIGPHRGGRVVAVTGDVRNPTTFYFGACAGGVWKTTDAGNTWRNISDGFFATAAVGALALAPSDSNVLYAGMGETCIRNTVSHGDGVYRSTDAGQTWKHIGLAETRHIGKIRIHPDDPNLVYVAALGNVWGPNQARGIFRSRDGGETWEHLLFVSERAGCHDLALDPTNPRVLYAAVWEAQRSPHALSSGGPGSGLWKSVDGGDTWRDLTRSHGLPGGVLGKIGVAVSPAQPGRVWALVEAEDGGLFRSDDGGETWELVSDAGYLRTRAFYYMHVIADPMDPETVWVLNYQVWKSPDGGRAFTCIPSPHGDEHDLWIHPRNPEIMIKGDDGGACVSLTGGRSWSTQYNQPTAQMYHVTTDDGVPYRVYGSQQDNSAISIPSRTLDGAIHERDWYAPGGGESGHIAIKPDDPNLVVASGPAGRHAFNDLLIAYDHRTGQKRNITVWPELHGWGVGAEGLRHRFAWTFPIMYSRHEPHVLYVAGNRVFRSTDDGGSFEAISDDLTSNDPARLVSSGGPLTQDNTGAEVYCTIFALAESPVQPGLLWAGSDDGRIHVSTTFGQGWDEVTPADLPEWALISIIDPSPHDAGTAYVAATRYKLDDARPYLHKTTDYGQTWTKITDGIPEDDFTRVIRVDPERPGLLYAGTETGLYLSWDDGAEWHRLGGNVPVVPVYDLAVKGDDLVVATHGRSFWILDDLQPLRRLADLPRDASHCLFPPRPTVRLRSDDGVPAESREQFVNYGRAGTSVFAYRPRRTTDGDVCNQYLTAGANPPSGVTIQYYLREEPRGAVRLTILDERGKELRSLRGGAPGDGEGSVPARPGVNRCVWDLRLPGAVRIDSDALQCWHRHDGPMVLPGRYQVRLEVDGWSETQPIEVQRDPRVTCSDAGLQAQLDMLLAIRDCLSRVNGTINWIESARRHLAPWMEGGSAGQEVATSARAFDADLLAIERELIDLNIQQAQVYPSGLHEKLNALFHAVDSADYPPTAGARTVFAELCATLEDVAARLRAVTREGRTSLEVRIAGAGLTSVGAPLPE